VRPCVSSPAPQIEENVKEKEVEKEKEEEERRRGRRRRRRRRRRRQENIEFLAGSPKGNKNIYQSHIVSWT
jgi:hypothetical protein